MKMHRAITALIIVGIVITIFSNQVNAEWKWSIYPSKAIFNEWNFTFNITIRNNLNESMNITTEVYNPSIDDHTRYKDNKIFDSNVRGEGFDIFENFTNLSWINITNKFFLPAKTNDIPSEITIPVSVNIPRENKYSGKHFEAKISFHSDVQWMSLAFRLLAITPDILNKKPIIDIPSSYVANAGEEVIFNASNCYDPDGKIIKYEWQFLDFPPFKKKKKIVTHTWNEAKSIYGILTVYDSKLASSSKSFIITIEKSNNNNGNNNNSNGSHKNKKPIASFTIDGNLSKGNMAYLNSTSYDIDGYIVNYTWNIDNGNFFYGSNITYMINKSNDIPVQLIVMDNDGLYNITDGIIKVKQEPIIEYYRLIVFSNKNIRLNIIDINNNSVFNGSGIFFETMLEKGYYTITYCYNNTKKTMDIYLDSAKKIFAEVKEGQNNLLHKTPSFSIIEILTCMIFITVIIKRLKHGGK